MANKPHVLIIVQNLSVPYDRRVWLECNSLIESGFKVSVICPRSKNDLKKEILNRVEIYRYAPPFEASGILSFFIEFAYCFIRTFLLAVKINFMNRIDVIQTCNPPDTYWFLAMILKPLGATYVFDQHDLCPEIFDARFNSENKPSRLKKILRSALVWFEKKNYSLANEVIATNESYEDIALDRGNVDPKRITVVRSGPNPERLYPVDADKQLLRGHKNLIVYIGVMGPQDRVDIAIDAMAYIVNELNRDDVALALLGDGDCFKDLKKQSTKLGLDDHIEFVGRAGDEQIRKYFSSATIGIAPDPATPFNSHSTHNKIMEYMIFSLPVVAFDLKETKKSAKEAALIVKDNAVPKAFGDAIVQLIDDSIRSSEMGEYGRKRVLDSLTWDHQSRDYVKAIFSAYKQSRRGKSMVDTNR